VNYSHPSQARTRKNRTEIRSLITKKQHQREKLLAAAIARSKADQAENAGNLTSQISHVAAASLDRPTFKENLEKLEKFSPIQPPEGDFHSKYSDHANLFTLRSYIRWSDGSVIILATRNKKFELTSVGP
jgi:hypothetical protein